MYKAFHGDFAGISPLTDDPQDSEEVTDAREYVDDFRRTRLADACGSMGEVDKVLEDIPSSLHFSRQSKLSSAKILQYLHVCAARNRSLGSRNDKT